MSRTTARFAALISSSLLLVPGATAQDISVQPSLDPLAVNAARLDALPLAEDSTKDDVTDEAPARPDPAIVRLQILLDRAGASPGVIDGFDGDNVRKAVLALEAMSGLSPDGQIDDDLIERLETGDAVIGAYTITADDLFEVTGPVPEDYSEKAQLDFLGYETPAEAIAEQFHMDVDLLEALNPGASFSVGETVSVAAYGPDLEGEAVARIEADKRLGQVRAYGADGRLIVAYPATIGSEDNPSPDGVHLVEAVAPMPTYTYNPKVNFQQGDNTEVLTIPAGPNGPVGSMWIDLSEPTFGIHGTPEPSLIDKVGSHGCVRLTNWDAEELAAMVSNGVSVEFLR